MEKKVSLFGLVRVTIVTGLVVAMLSNEVYPVVLASGRKPDWEIDVGYSYPTGKQMQSLYRDGGIMLSGNYTYKKINNWDFGRSLSLVWCPVKPTEEKWHFFDISYSPFTSTYNFGKKNFITLSPAYSIPLGLGHLGPNIIAAGFAGGVITLIAMIPSIIEGKYGPTYPTKKVQEWVDEHLWFRVFTKTFSIVLFSSISFIGVGLGFPCLSLESSVGTAFEIGNQIPLVCKLSYFLHRNSDYGFDYISLDMLSFKAGIGW